MQPLLYLHGSTSPTVTPGDEPLYLTPNPDYSYIQTLPHIYSCELQLSTPYHVDSVGAIERLRSAPEHLQALRQAGYDAVVYCAPHQPTRGASGWGNDAAQYLVLDTSKIHHWQPCERPAPAKLPATKPVISKPVFHATDTHFQQFEHSVDVGFHFGSRQAALARHQGAPKLDIEHVAPSALDQLSLQAANNTLPRTPQGEMLGFVLKRVGHPKANMVKSIMDMDLEELAEVGAEFRDKPVHPNFHTRCERATQGEGFHVKEGERVLYRTDNRADAKMLREHASNSYLKQAVLNIGRPLELPDLGRWSPRDVLKHAGADTEQLSELAALPNEAQPAYVQRTLNAMGYDSIAYTNEVEDPGSVSYIVFDAKQIHLIPPKLNLPEPPTHTLHHAPKQA
jgi:hypothetical protein